MPQIELAKNDWESVNENIPRMLLRNLYIAENPYSEMCYLSRPSLTEFVNLGSGPIRGYWYIEGAIDNAWLVVSGNNLYKVTIGGLVTLLGLVPGSEYASFAGNQDRVVIVRDGIAYITDGISLTVLETAEPGQQFSTVACISEVFILPIKDTFRFYWLLPEESVIDPLNFASAENFPDPIISVAILSDEIWFIGTDSCEVWAQTEDIDAPYVRIAGRTYTDGALSKDSLVTTVYQNFPCLIWVNSDKEVVLAQGKPNVISNQGIEERLRSATNFRAWTFRRNRCDFYVLTTDQFTLVYNINYQSWSTWDSFDKPYWTAHLGIQVNSEVFAGDSETGTIWRLVENPSNNIVDAVVSEISGFIPLAGKQQQCASVNLRVNVGITGSYTVEPEIELRYSDDYGFTFSQPVVTGLGLAGRYNTDVTFRSLGVMQRPGRHFVFRFTNLLNFRLDYVTVNEV